MHYEIHLEYWPTTDPTARFHYRNIACQEYAVENGMLTAKGCNAEGRDIIHLPMNQVKEYWVSRWESYTGSRLGEE